MMIYAFEDYVLDTQRITLLRAGQPLALRPKVFQVLTYLIEHRERFVTKQELCEQVWAGQFISEATLESAIYATRQTIGDNAREQRVIQTVRGYGYRFLPAVEEHGAASVSPTVEALAATAEPPETPDAEPSLAPLPATILVVDDEPLVLIRMQAVLLPRGYTVLTATSGAEALQLVQHESPDLILLDVMMPGLDGFAVCQQLKEHPDTQLVPVVLMTALGSVEDRVKGLTVGADDFLTKPVHRDELLARIQTSLRLKHTIDARVAASRHPPATHVPPVLYLTITCQNHSITMDLATLEPVVARAQMLLDESLITEINQEYARLTALAGAPAQRGPLPAGTDTVGTDTEDAEVALQHLGGLIFAHLFPPAIQQQLAGAAPADLILRLDAHLVHIPWELAFDGSEFAVTKFRLGRQVISPSTPAFPGPARAPAGLKMLIIADPTGADQEAVLHADWLGHQLADYPFLQLQVHTGTRLRKIDLLQWLRTYDLIHYLGPLAGHAAELSRHGWPLHGTVLTVTDLAQVHPLPALLFVSVTQAYPSADAPADSWLCPAQASRLGSLCLLAGTQHYIGSCGVVPQDASTAFAADFYHHLLRGESVGAALLSARRAARLAAHGHNAHWATYVHYGHPMHGLPVPPPA